MKVLLIRPHITLEVAQKLRSFLHLEPLALEIVAGGIGERHDVRILDLACRPDPLSAFRGMLGSFEPDVVGFTGYSNQAETVKQLARECRGLLPDALIMVGGIHATVVPEDYGRCDAIDLVVRGEGGTAIRRFFRTFETKGTIPEDDALLPVRSPDFAQRCRSRPPQLPPYEEIPRARRDLVDRSRYFCVWHGKKREHLPTLFPRTAAMRTSWGCPNRCNFCVVHYLADGKYRQRSPESTVEAIDSIPEEHIYFVDDEMFINARRCRAIAELLIERDIDKQYVSWARADTICRHPELFALWKKAGLSLLYVGLESMDADALEGFNKGIKPGVNRKAVRILKSLGIGLHAAFMV
ncbi:MAG: B12-binding domain-containing radical SAM protein, partial [Planctomycetota bacterium]